jgi:hypothetical protein
MKFEEKGTMQQRPRPLYEAYEKAVTEADVVEALIALGDDALAGLQPSAAIA